MLSADAISNAAMDVPSGVIPGILMAAGAVVLAPLFKLLFDRVAAGDRAWYDRVSRLETELREVRSENAELRGEVRAFMTMVNEERVASAKLKVELDQAKATIAEQAATIAEQDLLNEQLNKDLKAATAVKSAILPPKP